MIADAASSVAVAGWQTKDWIIAVVSSGSILTCLANLSLVPWLTHRFTNNRRSSDKVWDARLRFYNEIIRAIYQAIRVDDQLCTVLHPEFAPHCDANDLRDKWRELWDCIDRVFELQTENQVICSRQVALQVFDGLQRLQPFRIGEPTYNGVRNVRVNLVRCVEKVTAITKRELGIERDPAQRFRRLHRLWNSRRIASGKKA